MASNNDGTADGNTGLPGGPPLRTRGSNGNGKERSPPRDNAREPEEPLITPRREGTSGLQTGDASGSGRPSNGSDGGAGGLGAPRTPVVQPTTQTDMGGDVKDLTWGMKKE